MFIKTKPQNALLKVPVVVAQVGLELCCCPLPAQPCQAVCIIPFEHGENKGVGVYFLRDLYSWQLFWGRKEKRSVQTSEIMSPLPFPIHPRDDVLAWLFPYVDAASEQP